MESQSLMTWSSPKDYLVNKGWEKHSTCSSWFMLIVAGNSIHIQGSVPGLDIKLLVTNAMSLIHAYIHIVCLWTRFTQNVQEFSQETQKCACVYSCAYKEFNSKSGSFISIQRQCKVNELWNNALCLPVPSSLVFFVLLFPFSFIFLSCACVWVCVCVCFYYSMRT